MATKSGRPRRFDLRETIPLATATLVNFAKKPKRSWIVPALTLVTGIALASVILELIFSPASASASGFKGELRSRLLADYAQDPVAARIHELKLTIVEDVLGVDEGDGSSPTAIAVLMKDPVPTATPKATAMHTRRPVASPTPGASSEPTVVVTASALPAPSSTPSPPPVMATGGSCDDLSITSMWVESRDEIRARVRNDGPKDAHIVHTMFEWPDVPPPTYVDWFKFDGDRYYKVEDADSPTVTSERSRRLKDGETETWIVDFDDKPESGIFGSFKLTLTLEFLRLGTCTLSASTFKDIPAPTPGPTETPRPTDTPEATRTDTATPTDIPVATATASATALPTVTSTPEFTATPQIIDTLTPSG